MIYTLLAWGLAFLAACVNLSMILCYQWVTFLPFLGLPFLLHIRKIQLLAAGLTFAMAAASYLLHPSNLQLLLAALSVALISLSGLSHASHILIALDDPPSAPAAEARLREDAVVIGLAAEAALPAEATLARAWAADMLVLHHLINDRIGEAPVLASWCQICRSAAVYLASLNGKRLTFEAEAVWRRNLVMRDRETGSLWQQASGECIAGPLKGALLTGLGGEFTGWREWKQAHPQTSLALEPKAWKGRFPRAWVEAALGRATLRVRIPGVEDARLLAESMVVGLSLNGQARAYPLMELERRGEIVDVLGGERVRLVSGAGGLALRGWAGDAPVMLTRIRWAGWVEFHPGSDLYQSS